MKNAVQRNRAGQGMTEYGLIIGLIAIIVLAGFLGFSPSVKKLYAEALTGEDIGKGQASLSAALYE